MKAICVNADRRLEVRDVPTPNDPPPAHLIAEIQGAAINHGDKSFLINPGAAASRALNRTYDIWGASAAGRVVAVGEDVAPELVGRHVAIYRSLSKSAQTLGLWSEQVLVERTSCVVLPEKASPRDYSGSLVNAVAPYAFLEQIAAQGHKGVIVTAGTSATGLAMAALAPRRGVPAIFLTRSEDGAAKLRSHGVEHVLVTIDKDFESDLSKLAAELGTTAVFDGVGGELTSRVAPTLPMYSAIYFYGFLGAAAPVIISSLLIMSKNLVLQRFSNFASETVTDPQRLTAAITYLEGVIGDPLFHTQVGKEFAFHRIDAAMAYEAMPARKRSWCLESCSRGPKSRQVAVCGLTPVREGPVPALSGRSRCIRAVICSSGKVRSSGRKRGAVGTWICSARVWLDGKAGRGIDEGHARRPYRGRSLLPPFWPWTRSPWR